MKKVLLYVGWSLLIGTLFACGGSGGTTLNANDLAYEAPVEYVGLDLPPNLIAFNDLGHAVGGNNYDPVFWDRPNHPVRMPYLDDNQYFYLKAINNSDQIVGASYYATPYTVKAVYYSSPTSKPVILKTLPNAIGTYPSSINDKGEIVGVIQVLPYPKPAYWHDKDAEPVLLDSRNDVIVNATNIDNSGVIHGCGSSGATEYLWNSPNSAPVKMTSPTSDKYVAAYSFSPSGIGAGAYGEDDGKFTLAGYWAPGATQATPMPQVNGFAFARMASISDTGFATGYFPNSFGTNSAFISYGGVSIDLKNVTPNQNGWDFVKGLFVDAAGNITVQGWKNGKYSYLFLRRAK